MFLGCDEKRMAGTAGLEPANAGIKTPCLNRLGDVPAERHLAILDHFRGAHYCALPQYGRALYGIKLKSGTLYGNFTVFFHFHEGYRSIKTTINQSYLID